MFRNYQYQDGRISQVLVLMLTSHMVTSINLTESAIKRHKLPVKPGKYVVTSETTKDGKWSVIVPTRWR